MMKLSTTALFFFALCNTADALSSLGIRVYNPEQLALRKIPSMMPQVNIHLQVMPLDADAEGEVAFGRTVADYSRSAVMVDGTLAFGRTYDSISALPVSNRGKIPFEAAVPVDVPVDGSVAFGRRVRDYSRSAIYMDAALAFGRTYDSIGATPVALAAPKVELPGEVLTADKKVPLRAFRAHDLDRVVPVSDLSPWMPADETAQALAARELEETFEELSELFADSDFAPEVHVMAGQEFAQQPVEKRTF